jgi:hypothetical protein
MVLQEKIVLDTSKKYIWSSSPLYSAAIRKKEKYFYAALQNKVVIDEQTMYQFHRYTDMKMSRMA